jgi:hypothetical protein
MRSYEEKLDEANTLLVCFHSLRGRMFGAGFLLSNCHCSSARSKVAGGRLRNSLLEA